MIVLLLFVIFRFYAVSIPPKTYSVLSGQYSRRLELAERRGFIYDRNGKILNMKQDGYICVVNPAAYNDKLEISEELSLVSEYSQSEITEKMAKNVPFILRTKSETEISGISFFPTYKKGAQCAPHIVGYTDSDGRGVAGTEKYFDRILSEKFFGKITYRYMSDALGTVLDGGGDCLSDSGYSEMSGVYLTLDADLQIFCEELAKQYGGSGAICVTGTQNGQVLACVSFPGFDSSAVADYLDSDKGELINRGITGFTPGSVFKTVVAAAALEYDPKLYNMEYECCGSYKTDDGDVIPCHNKEGHGVIDMKTAYAQSCNPYFINLAHKTGEKRITETAALMGLSKDCMLDGVFGFGSVIPEYEKALGTKSGYLANLAIGQGKMLVSPLGVCSMFSCAATGIYTEPGILSEILAGDIRVRDYTALRKSRTVLSEETASKLSEMMLFCVEDGLGKEAKPSTGNAGGKTATAQTGILSNGKEVLNCWFCGIYPAENPTYTVCVLYCDTRNSGTAKRIFGKVCDYLTDKKFFE